MESHPLPEGGSGVPPLSPKTHHPSFFNPEAGYSVSRSNLPHWRQNGATYFITFRLVDSLPAEKLHPWFRDRDAWRQAHPEPRTEDEEQEYHRLFSDVMETWLDQGSGSRVLELEICQTLVETALRFFEGQRYQLGEFVVAANHVHVIVTPFEHCKLSDILHSWKSFTAKEIVKVEAAARRLQPWWEALQLRQKQPAPAIAGVERTGKAPFYPRGSRAKPPDKASTTSVIQHPVWQKESFDHLVRSAASLEKFSHYIRSHREWPKSGSGVPPLSP